jgi:hypothetical protein
MKACWTAFLPAILWATGAPAQENPLLEILTRRGVVVADGTSVRLPAPTLPPGMDGAAQETAISAVAGKGRSADLLRKSLQAPFVLNVRTLKTNETTRAAVRSIDLYFVAHGDWKTANSNEFLDGLWKSKQETSSEPAGSKAVELKPEECARRNVSRLGSAGVEERFVYTVAPLLEKVELSAAIQTAVARSADSVVMAQRILPAFTGDAEYPNQWRPLTLESDGTFQRGPAQSYQAAAAYGCATRLAVPAGAIFFEYHLVYEEPEGWFGGVNVVKQRLPLVVQDQLMKFRRRLAGAGAK